MSDTVVKIDPEIVPFGGRALLARWPEELSAVILNNVLAFASVAEELMRVDSSSGSPRSSIVEVVPSNNSVLVMCGTAPVDASKELSRAWSQLEVIDAKPGQEWEIPVCYGDQFGLDLSYLAQSGERSVEDVIGLHSNASYTVYSIGFLPGFVYLGGLPEELHKARRGTPRPVVPAGSVAIGGVQTGIYPQNSPGGWHIVGNSPIPLFDVTRKSPCLVSPGDHLTFRRIDDVEHKHLASAVSSGSFDFNLLRSRPIGPADAEPATE